MAYSEAQKKATAKYMKNKLDDIKVRVPKGKREVYKAHAERQGKSLNALIIELLEKDMQEED
jgi:predicted HicB family RNase H-like nuclease